jgi:hypothetical protein
VLAQNLVTIETKATDEYAALWANDGAPSTWGEFDALFAGYADSERRFIAALGSQAFPESMQADLQSVLGQTEAEQAINLELSKVQTDADAKPLLQRLETAWVAAGKARDQLRKDLGLPATPGATAPTFIEPAATPTSSMRTATPTAQAAPTVDTYAAAQAYATAVQQTYAVAIPKAEVDWSLKLSGWYCRQSDGVARHDCLVTEEKSVADPMLSAAEAHLTWMSRHQAASCFDDAYAADKDVANAYVTAANEILANLGSPWEVFTLIPQADSAEQAFDTNFSSYFSDCG